MRLHISLDDELVAELDRRVGSRKRSAYIAATVRQALDDELRWERLISAAGALGPDGGDWGDDAAAWVHEQRRADPGRFG